MFVGWEDGKWGNSRGHWMKQMNWMASSTSDEPSRILTCDWNASYGFMKRTLTAADKGLRAPDKAEIYSNVCAQHVYSSSQEAGGGPVGNQNILSDINAM